MVLEQLGDAGIETASCSNLVEMAERTKGDNFLDSSSTVHKCVRTAPSDGHSHELPRAENSLRVRQKDDSNNSHLRRIFRYITSAPLLAINSHLKLVSHKVADTPRERQLDIVE